MPNRHETLSSLFNDIADQIRSKTGGTEDLVADNFDTSISGITTLIEGTEGDTASASDVLSGKTAHTDNGTAITGTMTNNGAVTDTITTQGGTYTIPAGYHNGSGKVTASLGSGAYSASVSSHSVSTTPVVTPSISGSVTGISTTTAPSSGTDGTDYWILDPSGSVTTTGKSSATGKATIGTSGYLSTGNKTSSTSTIDITPSVAAGTNRYITKASSSVVNPTASATNGTASVTKQPTASASISTNGIIVTSTDTGYSMTGTASAASGTISATGGSASTTAGSATVGVGYNPSEVTVSTTAQSASGTSASTTEQTASDSETVYIQSGSLTATASLVSEGSASMGATGFTGSTDATSYYVTLSTSAGYARSDASVGTEGYVKSETDSETVSVGVSGNGTILYIPEGSAGTPVATKGTVSNNSISVTPSATSTEGYIAGGTATGDAVTVSASELVSGNKSLASSASDQTNIDVTNYQTVSISAMAASSLTNSIISGTSYEEATGDYAWKSTVTIPAGYHTAQTLEKNFSTIFPAPDTPGTAGNVLLGYQFYDKDGKLVTGTMANNGAVTPTISTQGGTYTVPAGYHNGSGVITASLGNATITSGAGSATISDPSYDSTNDNFTLSASGTVAAPTVGTDGYISSSAGTKNTNSISGSKTLSKVEVGASISGTSTTKPVISRTAKPSEDTWVDAASGAATTTKPLSGVYVQVNSASNTGTLTATPSVTSAGYGTTTTFGSTNATATVGAQASDDTYIPITTTTASVNGKTVSYGTGWITEGSQSVSDGSYSSSASVVSNGSASISATSNVPTSSTATSYYIELSTSAGSAKGTATVGTAGYVTTGSIDSSNVSVPVTGNGNKIYLDVSDTWSGGPTESSFPF